MATINEFVSRQCDSVEMRTLDFLSLYQQSDVHPRVQKIAELYRQIIADGGLHYLKIPPADNSGGVIPRAPSRQSLTEFSAVPAVAPAAVAVQPLPRYASPGIDADVLDPKAANKRRRLEANSPHTTLLPLGQMTSVKSGRRGSASSLSSSDDSDGSSSEADGPPRGVIIPQPGMMPFQDITPKHASLTVRQPSFASSQHGDSVVVPIAIQAGRYRSASSVPASSASSASSQSSTSGSESDQEAEEAKPSVTIKDTQVVHEMIAGIVLTFLINHYDDMVSFSYRKTQKSQ